MKFNKFKAFTLAEVMILLLTLSILMAAFAPVFTRRVDSYSSDDVWAFVSGDDNNDAYFDVPNKSFTAQAIIGISPANKLDVMNASTDNNALLDPLYSKLIIRANKLGGTFGSSLQNQMQFRYSNSNSSAAGSVVGALFAGNYNMMVGGKYNSIGDNAKYNASFGSDTLSAITSGSGNTAVGSRALTAITSGSYNTAIGTDAAVKLSTGSYNTVIGNHSLPDATSTSANTIIGYSSGSSGIGNTAVGNNVLKKVSGNYNTAAGNSSLSSLGSGNNNTAVGYYSMANLTSGSNNTAFGDNSCLLLTSGSNKTCIGSFSGSRFTSDSSSFTPSSSLFSGSDERVFIGSRPYTNTNGSIRPAAVLEVHNVSSVNNNSTPILGMGNASVVVNGNLVVRGQTYLEFPMIRQRNIATSSNTKIPKGLVLFKFNQAGSLWGFSGYDGAQRTKASYGSCNGCRRHEFNDIRPNCICTIAGSGATNTSMAEGSKYTGSTSYDWTTKTNNTNGTGGCDANGNSSTQSCYKDGSTGSNICLARTPSGGNASTKETDLSYAHMKGYNSCCPNLKSDIRLKNVGDKFTAGLDEIRKLNIYNYTYKNDPDNLPHVGVIAQDLKRIFPNAVIKGDNGYYKIRWDEMFYAAINSIKALNTKIEKLASKIATDRERLIVLKKDNAELNVKLDKLADELAQIEAKKNK